MSRRIEIGSVTYAQKAKRALLLRGIHSRLSKTEGVDGCVYAIDVREGDFPAALEELHRLGIEYRLLHYDIP